VEQGRGKLMTRRTLRMPALLVAAVLVACAVVLLAVSEGAEAAFPGKNGRIAYNEEGVIYTINPDGSGKSKVVNTSEAGSTIDYSPDGKRITYASYEGFNDGNPAGPQKDHEIYTINVDGTGKFQLTHNNRYDSDPSYSPDGKRVAYTRIDGHDAEIYTINADGTGAFRVTNNDTNEFFPSYSPDGKKIVFSGGSHRKLSRPWTYTEDIFTIGVNGKNRVRLTYNYTTDSAPDYSPDGRRIAFAGFVDSAPFSQKVYWNIYTIRARGGGKIKVVGGGADPDYSPDGKKIVYYTGSQLRHPDIYTINVGGGGKSKVAVGQTPAWGSRP
jgi:Tol biopolymer transport system component